MPTLLSENPVLRQFRDELMWRMRSAKIMHAAECGRKTVRHAMELRIPYGESRPDGAGLMWVQRALENFAELVVERIEQATRHGYIALLDDSLVMTAPPESDWYRDHYLFLVGIVFVIPDGTEWSP